MNSNINGIIFPVQKLETNKKTKEWSVKCIDYVINTSMNQLREDLVRMLNSYKLVNSMLDEDDYKSICKNLGISTKHGKKFVQAYNKTHNILSTLKGEELQRPFSYSVINQSPNAMNEMMREQELDYRAYLSAVYKSELEKIKEQISLEVENEIQGNTLSPRELERAKRKAAEEIAKKYEDLLDLDALRAKYDNKLTTKETTINKLLKMMLRRQNIQWVRNETFSDAVITAKEMVEIRFEIGDHLPKIRQLNPLNVFYHKSPDTPFIHDSDYAGYKEELTIGQVIDLYGEKMHKKDLEKLQKYTYDGSGVYGTSDSMFHRHKPSSDDWASKAQAGMYPTGLNADPFSRVEIDGKIMGIPHATYSGSSAVFGPGLYADERLYNRPYAVVYTVYWKSYRKMYRYEFLNEYGQIDEEIVDESFVIPDNAKKESYKDSQFGPKKYKHVWYDKGGNYNAAEEIWIPEIYKGIRINGDIYVDIGPLEHAYQSLLSPYKAKIPIYGLVYNSRNTGNVSIVDNLKPWQKLYYVLMAKLLKILAQDKGVLTFLNVLMIDKKLGLKKTLEIAEEQNLIPYNPLSHSKGGGFVNTLKVAEKVDATNSNVVQYYISLLEFVESNLMEAAGMSPQRLAQTKSRTTATDNARDVAHSMNITESLFNSHDMLWEEILQGYMEMTVSSLNDKSGKIRGFLDDDEIAVLDLGKVSLEDEYLLRVENNVRNYRILDQAYQLSHALIQNDKANLSTLIKLMKNDDLTEFTQELQAIEEQIARKEERLQQMQAEKEEKLTRMQLENREDEQKARLDETYLRGLMDHEKEHIRGRYLITSYNLQNDANQNGIPDLMENQLKYQELLRKTGETESKMSKEWAEVYLRKEELEQRKQEFNQQLSQKEREAMQKAEEARMKDRREKEQIEVKKEEAKTKKQSNNS